MHGADATRGERNHLCESLRMRAQDIVVDLFEALGVLCGGRFHVCDDCGVAQDGHLNHFGMICPRVSSGVFPMRSEVDDDLRGPHGK
ncbi:hypothetical protein Z051_01010 [Rhodococcus rhodochrous KG-21]|uniref:Uncharacterized protein n=1 Tax=Rhodococcus rhodochrous KG-21 TaxID=1441923 RepID=A0A0M8PTD1_RHORH|nr:hypothetical protein Z051_01010 [Rhodococcus rhodochrous KG-21]